MNEFGLERDNPADQERCISILSHCYFEQYILNLETQWDLEAYIGYFFWENHPQFAPCWNAMQRIKSAMVSK